MYRVFTDGSCKGNGKENAVGAWAYAVYDENDNLLFDNCGAAYNTTNNRMEMEAVINGIFATRSEYGIDSKIEVYTDSAYIHNCMSQKWYKTWEKNGWKNASKQPVKKC